MGLHKHHYIVHEDENFSVVRYRNRGRGNPPKVKIMFHTPHPTSDKRELALTIDELFDLTEVLDDLCDFYEDRDEDHLRG